MSSWTEQIESDLRWREAELGSLKLAVASAPTGSDRQRALLRALLAMLYAHYEGFSKFCWELFLDEVEKVACTRAQAVQQLAELSLEKVIRNLRGNTSTQAIWEFVHTVFPAEMVKPLSFPVRPETQSNLWPNLAMDNVHALGLSCPQIDEHRQLLRSLVGRRNEIAHGQKLEVRDLAEYEPYERAVMIVLHELAVVIVDHLEKRKYLRAGAV